MEEKKFNKNNKVLFIVHDLYQDDLRFPLGPAYLAAILDKNGAQVEAYCMDVFHYTNEQLAEHLENNNYDIIGLGFLAARYNETIKDLCEVINAHKKNAWFVLGSHGPSPIPEYVLKNTGADLVAIGEAENTIVDLLQCKISNGDLDDVLGIAYLKNGDLKITGPHKPTINLDQIPFPFWEIFPMERYTTCTERFNQDPNEKSFGIITVRGCVNRCNFCYRMEQGVRARSVKNVVEEMKLLYDIYGVSYFILNDELFVISKKRLLDLEEELKKANLKIKFDCQARVDIFDKEILEILKRIGCQFVNFGFESSSDEVLKNMNKNASVEQNINVLKMVKEVGGIGMGLNFIWNNIGDTAETLRGNVGLIKKYNTYYQCRTIKPVTPYPGCDLYYRLIEMGKLKGPGDFFEKYKNPDLILVNNMEMSDEDAYGFLLQANTELIRDHYEHTGGDKDEMNYLIQQMASLYTGKITNFRGARHYLKELEN
ncbi:B12-binding domain-containing radical SAM protein [Candidatus Parcubacteria bacterium]|nr:B12-binding domain-containing radical SAM protein [Candidatus Parcubacteria bacterium]